MKTPPPIKRVGAFTLIEVLVSLGIFALAAVVLGAAYVNILVGYHTMRARAAEKSETALVRATLLGEPELTKAEKGGQIPLAGGGMLRWQATIEETTVADLFRVNLEMEISPGGRAASRRESQGFLLLRPTWSKADQREKLRAASRERLAERDF